MPKSGLLIQIQFLTGAWQKFGAVHSKSKQKLVPENLKIFVVQKKFKKNNVTDAWRGDDRQK